MPVSATLTTRAGSMLCAAPGAKVAAVAQPQFMHCHICKNLSVVFLNEAAAEEYLFFPLVPILSALIGSLGARLGRQQQQGSTAAPSARLSEARLGAGSDQGLLKLRWQQGGQG